MILRSPFFNSDGTRSAPAPSGQTGDSTDRESQANGWRPATSTFLRRVLSNGWRHSCQTEIVLRWIIDRQGVALHCSARDPDRVSQPSMQLFRQAAPRITSRSRLKLLTQEFCVYHATSEISLSGPRWWRPGTQGSLKTFHACGWDSSASFHPCIDRSHLWHPPSPTACCRITHTRPQHRRSISSAAGTVVHRREDFSSIGSVGSVFFSVMKA